MDAAVQTAGCGYVATNHGFNKSWLAEVPEEKLQMLIDAMAADDEFTPFQQSGFRGFSFLFPYEAGAPVGGAQVAYFLFKDRVWIALNTTPIEGADYPSAAIEGVLSMNPWLADE